MSDVNSSHYLVVGSQTCKYCDVTKKILANYSKTFDYFDYHQMDTNLLQELELLAGFTFRSVPQIFKETEGDVTYVGSFNELKKEISQ